MINGLSGWQGSNKIKAIELNMAYFGAFIFVTASGGEMLVDVISRKANTISVKNIVNTGVGTLAYSIENGFLYIAGVYDKNLRIMMTNG